MTDTIQKPRQKTHTPPAKQWRNWWETIDAGDVYDRFSGRTTSHGRGEIISSDATWPSKEIAEQKALEVIQHDRSLGNEPNRYLGAEPVE